ASRSRRTASRRAHASRCASGSSTPTCWRSTWSPAAATRSACSSSTWDIPCSAIRCMARRVRSAVRVACCCTRGASPCPRATDRRCSGRCRRPRPSPRRSTRGARADRVGRRAVAVRAAAHVRFPLPLTGFHNFDLRLASRSAIPRTIGPAAAHAGGAVRAARRVSEARGGRRGSGPGQVMVDFVQPQERGVPRNIDAERSVLGALMLHADALGDVSMVLRPEDFYVPAHQVIYRSICEVHDERAVADPIAVEEHLARKSLLAEAGGREALMDLVASIVSPASVLYHAEIVREKAIARRLLEACLEISRQAYENSMDPRELLEDAERRIFAIAREGQASEAKSIDQILA